MEPAADSLAVERMTLEPDETAERIEPRARAVPGLAAPHPWDGYLTGPENELAMAAAQAMARGEHEGISPLLVHGPSGVGKSRLLAGLVAERLRRQPGSAVAHLDAEAFAVACTEAAGAGVGDGWADLRDRLRGVDLFVLEDLEGLGRAPMARDELAHTLDALEAAGAAVAVSAQSAPGTWPRGQWPARLVNRLQGGLTARIEPPGPAARRRYVLLSTGLHHLALSAEAVEWLAQAADGYRTLDGWLARLALEARLGPSPGGRGPGRGSTRADPGRHPGAERSTLDLRTVATLFAEEALLAGPVATIDGVARAVAARFGLRLGRLRGPDRRASVVQARHLAMHLARSLTGSSFAAIGAYFGGRDPATVRHACKAAAERITADPALAAAVVAIGGRLTHR
ncbi:MAG TPA: DnaA/Hda family protein [Isosphaeraceae bacterium]|nr:DnaA/Hda family protein [Isosphaeraceae bacterium]